MARDNGFTRAADQLTTARTILIKVRRELVDALCTRHPEKVLDIIEHFTKVQAGIEAMDRAIANEEAKQEEFTELEDGSVVVRVPAE
jgi:hypothetical protein